MKGGMKSTLFGIGAAVATGIAAQLTQVCPDLLPKLPGLIVAGVIAGIGYHMTSPKDAK